MGTVFKTPTDLKTAVGTHLGYSQWLEITQERINLFADATGDHQWIHVDRERIQKESPFGAPVAHGYFTLSLIGGLFFETVDLKGFGLVINYGLNKVRFPAPLKEGARYRLSVKVGEIKDLPQGAEGVMLATIEVEGEAKPACAAEVVYRFVGA